MKRNGKIKNLAQKKSVADIGFLENSKLHLMIIFLLAVLLYANTLWNDYAQDDAIVITDNMFTKRGFAGLPGIFSKDSFYGFFKKSGKAKLVSGGRYRPLSIASFAVENQFFGLNPTVSHLINIILYGILGIVLYKVLLLIFWNIGNKKQAFFLSFVSVLLFIAHPVHTEVVANIKGRDEIFAMLFSFLAVMYSLKWYKNDIAKYQIFTFLFFLLALFSKENSITFLVVVPLIYFLFFKRRNKSFVSILFPFLAGTILFLIVRTAILGFNFGGTPMELMNNPFLKLSGGNFIPFTIGEKMATILFTLGKYIVLLIFPHPLTNDYYPRQISIMSFGDWQVILSAILYLGLIYFALKSIKKNKIIAFSILYYLVTLSIVSNIVFPVGTNMSERFLFMPSLGFSILSGLCLYYLFEKRKPLAFGVFAVLLLLYSVKTFSRNTVWKNDFTLFTTDVKVSGNSAKALNAAGGSLVDAAFKIKNKAKKDKMLRQAIGYLNKAVSIHPKYKNAYLLLGNANYFLKNYDKAISDYKKALDLSPNYEDAKKNLAITYRDAGKYYGEKKHDLKKAITYLENAFDINSDDYETVRLLGVANAMSGNKLKAIELFKKAVKMKPDNAGANLNLGNAYYNNGDAVNGKKYHDIARKIDPNVFDKN